MGARIGLPLGIRCDVARNVGAEVENTRQSLVGIPVDEGVALAGGIGRTARLGAGSNALRGDRAATSGVKRNGIAARTVYHVALEHREDLRGLTARRRVLGIKPGKALGVVLAVEHAGVAGPNEGRACIRKRIVGPVDEARVLRQIVRRIACAHIDASPGSESIRHRRKLGTKNLLIRPEGAVLRITCDNAVRLAPRNGVGVPDALLNVGESRVSHRRAAGKPVQDRGDHAAGERIVGAEPVRVVVARHQAVQAGIIDPAVVFSPMSSHIAKRRGIGTCRHTADASKNRGTQGKGG